MKRSYFLILCAIVFYFSGLLPGRILLPLDILCGSLPWGATSTCAGITVSNPVLSDQVFQFFPWRQIVRDGGWQALLWNPHAFAGGPLLGNGQSAMLYPPNWVHLLLPPTWSYVLLALLRTIVAAIATWAFARRHVSTRAAGIAAVAYSFSYTFVFSIGYPLGDAMALLPVLFWALDVSPVALAAATALELLAGQPETSAVAFLSVGAYFLSRRPTLRQTLVTATAVITGGLLALPQLLPLLQYLNLGAASRLRAEYNPLFYSAHTLLDFLTPEFFGTSSPLHRWGSNEGGYFGLLPALLIAAWVLGQPHKAVRNPFFWMFLASLAFIYRVSPIAWLLELPHLRTIFVTKFWASATFAGAIMAAFAFDEFEQRRLSSWILYGLLPGASCVALLLARWHFNDLIVAMNLSSYESGVLARFAVLLLLALLALRFFPSLAAAVLFLECFVYLHGYNTAAPGRLLFPKTPVIDFLKSDPERARIIGTGILPPNTAGVFGLNDARGYDAVTYWPYFQYMNAIDESFPDLSRNIALSPPPPGPETLYFRDRFLRPLAQWGDGFRDFLRRVYYWNDRLARVDRPALLNLLNVKYLLVAHGEKLPSGAEDYRLAYSGEVDAYENPHRLPRAFVVQSWEFVPDDESALAEIRRPDFDPRKKAILCCDSRPPGNVSSSGNARIISYKPTEVVVEAEGPGVLVLGDSHYPGWRLKDGQLFRADYLFRGVILARGPQTITFSYWPQFGR